MINSVIDNLLCRLHEEADCWRDMGKEYAAALCFRDIDEIKRMRGEVKALRIALGSIADRTSCVEKVGESKSARWLGGAVAEDCRAALSGAPLPNESDEVNAAIAAARNDAASEAIASQPHTGKQECNRQRMFLPKSR